MPYKAVFETFRAVIFNCQGSVLADKLCPHLLTDFLAEIFTYFNVNLKVCRVAQFLAQYLFIITKNFTEFVKYSFA